MSGEILALVTMVVTIIVGSISKKIKWFKDYMIPIQNLTIGLIFAIIEFIITKNFSLALAMSALMAGGTYDLVKNLKLAYQEFTKEKESTNKDNSSS